jgi:hypothetical protein
MDPFKIKEIVEGAGEPISFGRMEPRDESSF